MNIRKKRGFFGERYLLLPVKSYPELTNHSLVKGNYITEIGYFPTATYHYTERPQGSSENIFIFCVAGHGTIELENKVQFKLTQGAIFTIPLGKPHRYYADEVDPWTIIWFHFSTSSWDSFPLDKKSEIIYLSLEKQNRVKNHFTELFTMVDQQISLGNLICASNFLSLILAECYFMDEENSKKDKQSLYLKKCITYMNENISKNLQLAACAKYVGVSISYLNQIFKRYTQKSPIDYFIEMKMEEACRLLTLTDLKIYEIAEGLGYQNQFYFSKIFKKNIGSSPRDFRESASRIHHSL